MDMQSKQKYANVKNRTGVGAGTASSIGGVAVEKFL